MSDNTNYLDRREDSYKQAEKNLLMNILINRECTQLIATCNGIKTLVKQSSLLSDSKATRKTSCKNPDLKYKRL